IGTPAIPAGTRSRVESAGLFAPHPVQIQRLLRSERFARKIRRKRAAFFARARQSNRGHRTRDGFKRIYNSLRRQLPQRITRRRARLSTCFMTHGTMPPVQCSAILCEYQSRHEKQADQEKNESMRHNTSGSTGEMNHNSLIEFERISVMRGPTLALDNVSLKIGIGEHVALLAGRFTNEMSTGEARRMLIARALVHNPRTLILDEPSVALDLAAQHELRLILRKLAQSEIGIVMVTHHVSDLIPEIDRILLMNRGRIIADGPKDEVLVESKLSELFGRPLQLSKRDGYYNLW